MKRAQVFEALLQADLPAGVATLTCDVLEELERATLGHGRFHSAHEGYAVIAEELDELWDLVKAKYFDRDKGHKEAVQVAAMGLRFLLDVTG